MWDIHVLNVIVTWSKRVPMNPIDKFATLHPIRNLRDNDQIGKKDHLIQFIY